MKINLTTKLFAGFLLLLGLFAAVVVVNYRLAGQVLRNSQRVEASQHTSADGATLLRSIIDMETGFRGYLLLGNEQILQPYYSGERDLLNRFNSLRDELNSGHFGSARFSDRRGQRGRLRHQRASRGRLTGWLVWLHLAARAGCDCRLQRVDGPAWRESRAFPARGHA